MSELSEKIKLRLHNRIKKGTVEIKDLPDGESILVKKRKLKKSGKYIGQWRIINPPVIEQPDGSLKFIWTNFLFNGWRNLVKLLLTAAIFVFVFVTVHNLFIQFVALQNNVCYFSCFSKLGSAIMNNGRIIH
jgi:hypothetical protein